LNESVVWHYVTPPPVVKKQNRMQLAEEHCFGCASALHDCADENGYPTAH